VFPHRHVRWCALPDLPQARALRRPNRAANGSTAYARARSKHAGILLVRSIEWTVVEADTYDTALEQANVILWYLLGARLPLFFLMAFVIAYSHRCF